MLAADRQHVSVRTSVTRGWCVDMENQLQWNSHPAGAEPTALYHLHNLPVHSYMKKESTVINKTVKTVKKTPKKSK